VDFVGFLLFKVMFFLSWKDVSLRFSGFFRMEMYSKVSFERKVDVKKADSQLTGV